MYFLWYNDSKMQHFSFYYQKYTENIGLAQQYDGDRKGSNSAKQSIRQSQTSEQNSQIVSDGDTVGSRNNINVQNQGNSENNILA
jgi:hypothetical protein